MTSVMLTAKLGSAATRCGGDSNVLEALNGAIDCEGAERAMVTAGAMSAGSVWSDIPEDVERMIVVFSHWWFC